MAASLLMSIVMCASLAPTAMGNNLTHDVTYQPAPMHQRHAFLPCWSRYATDVAQFLGQPIQETTDFFSQLLTRTKVVGVLDLMYSLHPRLRLFLIFHLLVFCALLTAAVPITCIACRSRGKIPFLGNLVRPNNCVVYCISIGVLALLVLANLAVMLGCHSGMSDAIMRLPAIYHVAVGDLKLYINQTVHDVFAELEAPDRDISRSIHRFLYKILPQKALQNIKRIVCKGNNDLITYKLSDCQDSRKSPVATGIPAENTSGLLWEHLQSQLKRALDSVQGMETSIGGFEAQTGLLETSRVLGFVVVPMVMILLCVVVSFMGFGIGFGVRNRARQDAETWISSRCTGIFLLTNAALVVVFFAFATPLLMTMTTVGVLGEDYVCTPYRTEAYEQLDKILALVWPYAKRGEFFARLTSEHILTECAGDGVSIPELSTKLQIQPDEEAYKRTISQTADTTPPVTVLNATVRNCRLLRDVVRSTMNLFCDRFMDNYLGITLSLGAAMLLLLVVLPVVLAVSQYFLREGPGEVDNYQTSSSLFRTENSEEDLVSSHSKPRFHGMKNSTWNCCKSASSSFSSFLSDPWKSRLEDIYRTEGIDICNELRGKRSTLSSTRRSGRLSKFPFKTFFKGSQEKPLLSEAGSSAVDMDPGHEPFVNSFIVVDEVFPRIPTIPRGEKNKFYSGIRRKLICKTSLGTIDEESESLQSSYASALSNISELGSISSETTIV